MSDSIAGAGDTFGPAPLEVELDPSRPFVQATTDPRFLEIESLSLVADFLRRHRRSWGDVEGTRAEEIISACAMGGWRPAGWSGPRFLHEDFGRAADAPTPVVMEFLGLVRRAARRLGDAELAEELVDVTRTVPLTGDEDATKEGLHVLEDKLDRVQWEWARRRIAVLSATPGPCEPAADPPLSPTERVVLAALQAGGGGFVSEADLGRALVVAGKKPTSARKLISKLKKRGYRITTAPRDWKDQGWKLVG